MRAAAFSASVFKAFFLDSPFSRLGPLAVPDSTEATLLRSRPLRVQVPPFYLLSHRKKTPEGVSFPMVRDEGLEPPRSPART